MSECELCLHYRPQASFVDVYKEHLGPGTLQPVMQALLAMRKEETQVLESELEWQLQVIRVDGSTWPEPPRFAPICVAPGGCAIPAVKNRGGRCKAFVEAKNRQGCRCSTCTFMAPPRRQIGDRSTATPGGKDMHDLFTIAHQRDLQLMDADASAQALEIEQAFHGNGRAPVVNYLPTCAVQLEGGLQHVAPLCNLRHDCGQYSPVLGRPLEKLVSARERDDAALSHTLALARFVRDAGIGRPHEFLQQVASWAGSDASRSPALAWAARCVESRWSKEAPAGTPARAGVPIRTKDAPGFFPVVAGCDAYEWGLAAAMSRTSEKAAWASASAVCQQLAEFLVTVLSPSAAADCADAASALVKDLFAPAAQERMAGFLARLPARAAGLRLAARTDVPTHVERYLAAFLASVALWLRLEPQSVRRIAEIDPEHAEKMLARVGVKRRTARAEASKALDFLARLDGVSGAERKKMLAWVEEANDAVHAADVEDLGETVEIAEEAAHKQVEAQIAQATAIAGVSGAALGLYPRRGGISMKEGFEQHYWASNQPGIDRRKWTATLVLGRGLGPVTPTMLELMERKPDLDRTPETVEEALAEPVARTMEALHASRFGEPSAAVGKYLTSIRRIATPTRAAGAAGGEVSP